MLPDIATQGTCTLSHTEKSCNSLHGVIYKQDKKVRPLEIAETNQVTFPKCFKRLQWVIWEK